MSGFFIHMTREEFNQNLVNIIRDVLVNELPRQKEDAVKYLTREEVAERLRISLPTLVKYTKLGLIQGYKLGTRVLYKEVEIDAVLQRKEPLKYKRS